MLSHPLNKVQMEIGEGGIEDGSPIKDVGDDDLGNEGWGAIATCLHIKSWNVGSPK